jgi:hypothetical protein
MTALEFAIPAIKKDSANADIEALTRQVHALVKVTETLQSSLEESKSGFARAVEENRVAFNKALEDKTALLKVELDLQKAKSAGFIVIPGIRFAIDENSPELNLGSHMSQNPIVAVHSHEATYYNMNNVSISNSATNCDPYKFSFMASSSGISTWQGDITNLKYLKKCKKLTIAKGWDIKNFSPISEMTELEILNLVIDPQYSNSQSHNLSFQVNKTLDISFVKTLKKLKAVSFYGYTSLKDISPLTSCPALTSVDIRRTNVGNANCLSSSVTITK